MQILLPMLMYVTRYLIIWSENSFSESKNLIHLLSVYLYVVIYMIDNVCQTPLFHHIHQSDVGNFERPFMFITQSQLYLHGSGDRKRVAY